MESGLSVDRIWTDGCSGGRLSLRGAYEVRHHLKCDIKVINRIINERTSVSAEMALKLASAFNTTADFWLNAQKAIDIYEASKKIGKLPAPIKERLVG